MMFSAVRLHALLLLLLQVLILQRCTRPFTEAAAWLVTTSSSSTTGKRHGPPSRLPPNHRRGEAARARSSTCACSAVLSDFLARVQEANLLLPERLPTRSNDDDDSISVVEELQRRLYQDDSTTTTTSSRRSDDDDDDDSISVVEELQRRLYQDDSTTTTSSRLVQVEGYVIAKRAFGCSFCFLDLLPVPQSHSNWPQQQQQQQPVQAMLKRQEFGKIRNNDQDGGVDDDVASSDDNNGLLSFFDGYMKSIVPGLRLEIVGHVAPTRNLGEALILIRCLRIRGINRNPQHVRILLQSVAEHQLDAREIVHAIQASSLAPAPAPTDLTTFRWSTAAQLVQTLQQEKQQSISRIEKQPFYRLAKEIVSHLRPLQSGNANERNEQEPEDDLEKSLDRSLTSGKKHAANLLPMAGSDISQPPQEAFVYAASDFTFDEETAGVDSVKTAQEQFVQGNGHKSSSITVRAWVQNRRRFQNDITVLEAIDMMDASFQGSIGIPGADDFWNGRLKCVLHPDIFMLQKTERNQTIANMYGQLLAPGSLVLGHGYLSSSSSSPLSSQSSRPILWVTNVRLLRSSWRPSVVGYFLELVVEQQQRQRQEHAALFDTEEAIRALGISDNELDDIVSSDLTQRQWAAAEIAQNLQQGTAAATTRMGTVDPQHMAILESFHDLRRQYPVTPVHVHAPRREWSVNDNKSSSLSSSSSFTSTSEERQGSRWKRKKEPQLEWMTEQVRRVVESHPDYGTRPLQILDVGGGKGLLANRLCALGGNNSSVEIHVIDVARGAIKNGAMRSKRLALPVQYTVQDASTARIKGEIDVVVALHACGTLSDVALEQAVAHEAGFVICPCCFRSNPHLQITPRSQIGQPISLQQWLGIHDDAPEDWNALTSLAEVQGDIQLSQRAIHTICALRAAAFTRHSTATNKKNPIVQPAIKTFPMAFSTRNFCLVGTFS